MNWASEKGNRKAPTITKRTSTTKFFSSIFSYFPHQFVHCRDSDVQLAEIVRMFHPGKHFFQILLIDQSYSLIRMQIDYYEVYKQLNGTETSWQDISPAQLSFGPPRTQYIKVKTSQEITVDLHDCIF